jgi:hypothetical protein
MDSNKSPQKEFNIEVDLYESFRSPFKLPQPGPLISQKLIAPTLKLPMVPPKQAHPGDTPNP